MSVVPKEVYLIEFQDGSWIASLQEPHPKRVAGPVQVKSVYKIEIDWRLLEKEGHLRGTGTVSLPNEGDSAE